MIRGFVAEGRTVLLSSHLLDEVERICDTVAIVDRGRVVTQGPIDELAGGREPEVLIATSDDEEALAIVSGHRAVDRIDVAPRGHSASRSCPTSTSDAATDDISRRLTEGGLAIRRFERTRASLEQRFLEVTS